MNSQITLLKPKSTIVISLNKADLVAQEKLNKLSEAYNFDSEQVIATYITSAKTGQDVTNMFDKIAQAIALYK
ncbi:Rab family GTPase [Pleurocapsa sp. FMAR1]|uniref:Rab family GTPase n=1 Tax=Pleurocapsa sp. FMAR1 TaxID=3040204 RepID=UPI0039AEE9C7